MSLQEEAYMRRGEHETSKKHGKLRTKYNRLAWGVHVLTEVCKLFLACKEDEGFELAGVWAAKPLRPVCVVVLLACAI